MIFLLVGLLSILVALAMRIRGPDRVLYAALFAAALIWALHAGYDWDWEMPATGFFVFSVGAMAIAARPGAGAAWVPSAPNRIVRVAIGIACLALVVTPALVALSQGKLDSSVRNLERGDCGAASRDALDSIGYLAARPEPYQVLGFCDSRAGQHQLAITMLRDRHRSRPGRMGILVRAGARPGSRRRGPAEGRRQGPRAGAARTAGPKKPSTYSTPTTPTNGKGGH